MSILEEGRRIWDSKLNSNNITLNKKITDAIFHYIMTMWSLEWGGKTQDVGALSFAYYRYLHGGDIAIPQGYSVLLDILQKGFPSSAIKTGNEVTKIIWDQTGNEEASNSNNSQIIVEYTDKDGGLERINADHVIVTVSIGVLQKLHRRMIVPNMPRQKIRAVEKLQLGTVNKIFLYYENEFWDDGKFPLHIFWDSEIQKDFEEDGHWYKEIGFFHNPKENMLLVLANAYISRHILNHTNEEIGRLFTTLLRKIMNDNSIPLPDDILVTRWHQNDHFLGSYSFLPLGQNKVTKRIAMRPLKVNGMPKVLFAGEAMHLSRYSTIDGAFRTGRREAQRIRNFYQN